MKRCSKCKEVKPVDQFGKDALREDGLFPQCRKCRCRNPDQHQEKIDNTSKGLLRCSECREWLAPLEFYQNRASANGYAKQCKKCYLARAKKKYYSDVDAARARVRNWMLANPQQIKRRNFEHYWNNAERNRSRAREYYAANRDSIKGTRTEYLRNWLKSPRGRAITIQNAHKRRAMMRGTYTFEEWDSLLNDCGRLCLRCEIQESESIYAFRKTGPLRGKLTVDHIEPVSKGGWNVIANIQCLCMPCQLWKRDKSIDYRPAHVRYKYQ